MNQNKENKKEAIVYDYFKEYPEEYIDIKCVCFCIDDILFLHDILSKNIERFKGFYKYIFFSKTVQKIGDTLSDIKGALKKPNEFNIDEVKQEIEKKKIEMPNEIVNVYKCMNPRCITSIEGDLNHVFVLVNGVYRCRYCETRIK